MTRWHIQGFAITSALTLATVLVSGCLPSRWTVIGPIKGTVTDLEGQPVADAVVVQCNPENQERTCERPAIARTSPDGRFAFPAYEARGWVAINQNRIWVVATNLVACSKDGRWAMGEARETEPAQLVLGPSTAPALPGAGSCMQQRARAKPGR